MKKNDLVVIGAGTSGSVIAMGALRLGWKNVVLVEQSDSIGGSALHAGCVPSKSIVHIAQVANTVRSATKYGLESYLLDVDLLKINQYIQATVNKMTTNDESELHHTFSRLGGKVINGPAKFIDQYTIDVNGSRICGQHIVIATGSMPLYPAIKGLDKIGYLTNRELFSQSKLPKKLAILGGKPSAIEFAQAFCRLGSEVSVVVKSDSILPHEDPELVDQLKDLLIKEGIDIHVNSRVHEIYSHKDKKVLECIHDSGEVFILAVDEILVAEGRRPNLEGLALENAGVQYTPEGITVNDQMTTSRKHIYAAGDVVCSPCKFTHTAEYQANIVLTNMVLRKPCKTQYQGIPYVVFTDPEYAQVGFSEHQARAKGLRNINVARFDFSNLDSAIIKNSACGRIKVILSENKIVGASILGPDAGNLIAAWGFAIKLRASIEDVASTIHAYPTLAQINKRAANKHMQRVSQGTRKSAAWMQRMLAWS